MIKINLPSIFKRKERVVTPIEIHHQADYPAGSTPGVHHDYYGVPKDFVVAIEQAKHYEKVLKKVRNEMGEMLAADPDDVAWISEVLELFVMITEALGEREDNGAEIAQRNFDAL